MTGRRVFVLIHRCNGLLLAGFLTTAGVTGAALAWKIPLERVLAPHLFVLKNHGSGMAHADPLLVRRNVQQAYPWARVDVADLSTNSDAPLEFALTPKESRESIPSDDEVFADPFTGRILGSRRYGDLRQGQINLIPFLYRLHEDLALGPLGATCLGLVALLWTVDCFIGMYLSFPKKRRHIAPSVAIRLTSWFRRFSPSFKIRWNSRGFRRLYDLHRASGVWFWLLLLIFAWTGVAFNLPGAYQPVMRMFGSSVRPSEINAGCQAASGSELGDTWSPNLAIGRNLMRAQSERLHFSVKSERFLSYDPESCRWTYRVRSTLDVDSIGNTQLIWNQGQAVRAAFSAPTGATRADTFTTWIEAIHEAQFGGPVLRCLVCICGLITALLSITGLLIFFRKVGRVGISSHIKKRLNI